MEGLCKGSKKGLEVLKESVVKIGVQSLRVGGFIKVCIYIYKLLINRTKT